MDEQKIIRAIEHFETTLAEVMFTTFHDETWDFEVRVFEEILKLEGAEHLKFLFPYEEDEYNTYKNAVAVLWDMTEKEIKSVPWLRFPGWDMVRGYYALNDYIKGKEAVQCLRELLEDMKAERKVLENAQYLRELLEDMKAESKLQDDT